MKFGQFFCCLCYFRSIDVHIPQYINFNVMLFKNIWFCEMFLEDSDSEMFLTGINSGSIDDTGFAEGFCKSSRFLSKSNGTGSRSGDAICGAKEGICFWSRCATESCGACWNSLLCSKMSAICCLFARYPGSAAVAAVTTTVMALAGFWTWVK